jgi:hypothetical protein
MSKPSGNFVVEYKMSNSDVSPIARTEILIFLGIQQQSSYLYLV